MFAALFRARSYSAQRYNNSTILQIHDNAVTNP